jgi:hypothetical protein
MNFLSYLSPDTRLGKAGRDLFIFLISSEAFFQVLQAIDAIDFGSFDRIVGVVIGTLSLWIVRSLRPIKKESK